MLKLVEKKVKIFNIDQMKFNFRWNQVCVKATAVAVEIEKLYINKS